MLITFQFPPILADSKPYQLKNCDVKDLLPVRWYRPWIPTSSKEEYIMGFDIAANESLLD